MPLHKPNWDYQQDRVDDRDYCGELEAWFSDKSPDVWHHIVTSYLDWGAGGRMAAWIVTRRECDFATAAWILWSTDPASGLESRTPPGDPSRLGWGEAGDVFDTILENWRNGYYRRNDLALDAGFVGSRAESYRSGVQALLPGSSPAVHIPTAFFGPFGDRVAIVPNDCLARNCKPLRDCLAAMGAAVRSAEEEERIARNAAVREKWRSEVEAKGGVIGYYRRLLHAVQPLDFESDEERDAYLADDPKGEASRRRRMILKGLRGFAAGFAFPAKLLGSFFVIGVPLAIVMRRINLGFWL